MSTSRDITYNLHKVVFLMDKVADRVLEEHLKITFSQFRILMALDSDAVSQKDIADYWDMTEAAVSRQIEILVSEKFVSREENEQNRRQNILKLTKKGEEYLQKAFKILDDTNAKVYETLDERERQVLVEGLHKLLKVICTNKNKDPFISCK